MLDGWLMIGGIDVARGGSNAPERKGGRSGDDFCIATVRARLDGGSSQLVHIRRQTGIELPHMSYHIHKQHQVFHYDLLVCDPGGGGVFLADELRRTVQINGRESFQVMPIITENDSLLAGVGQPILCFFKRGEPKFERIGMTFPGESHLINKAHEQMRACFQHQSMEVPEEWEGWAQAGRIFSNPDQKRAWLNEQNGLSEQDRVRAEIDLAMDQMLQIDRENDKDGKPLLDKYNNFVFSSKRKKDSAYGVVYANFGLWLYRRLMEGPRGPAKKIPIVVESEDIN